MIWFTSDLHFFHKNVIKYCNRPWSTVEEMNEGLITRWNSVVGDQDQVFVLGDFCFGGVARATSILSRLKGHKVLIRGNHDAKPQQLVRAGFAEVLDQEEIYVTTPPFPRLTLSHYPFAPTREELWLERLANFWKFWRRLKYKEARFLERRPIDHGQFLLHGHVHNAWKVKGRMINVGVDAWNYTPVSIDQIQRLIEGTA